MYYAIEVEEGRMQLQTPVGFLVPHMVKVTKLQYYSGNIPYRFSGDILGYCSGEVIYCMLQFYFLIWSV